MPIPTEPIGSVPRTSGLLAAITAHGQGRADALALRSATETAVAETIAAMQRTGSPVVTDGVLPDLFKIDVSGVFMQMAGERDRPRIYEVIRVTRRPEQRVFVGVTDPVDPEVETPEIARDRTLERRGRSATRRRAARDSRSAPRHAAPARPCSSRRTRAGSRCSPRSPRPKARGPGRRFRPASSRRRKRPPRS